MTVGGNSSILNNNSNLTNFQSVGTNSINLKMKTGGGGLL